MYGGWANKWLSDCYALGVSSIVGPPYAIMSLVPEDGPIRGETVLDIYGIDFVNTADVTVSTLHAHTDTQRSWLVVTRDPREESFHLHGSRTLWRSVCNGEMRLHLFSPPNPRL